MRKLLLILLCLPMIGFGQNFTVTPNGLRDNTNLEKTYVVIYPPAMYVSKYVCDTKTNWGIVNNIS